MKNFCNCMSKKNLTENVIQPTQSITPSSSSVSTSASTSTSTSTTSKSDLYPSFSSYVSVSSRNSLSSLRDSLPDNPHLYHFKEIFTATKGFLSPKYSSSSSSASWRCLIRGDHVIVFQRKLMRPIDETELRQRLVVICKSHHSSLIKLRGASMSGSYIYLVYDFVKGVTLADSLKNPNYTLLSDWMSRIRIAADLAHGLDYIHNSTGLQKNFIHNHIKSSSVIVTESCSSLNAKICHFGTAELCGETDGGSKIQGTRGYMSPEFQSSGIATQKSDVYAFGVVILEILSGEEALKYYKVEEEEKYVRVSLIERAKEAVESGGVRRWVDRRLKDSFPEGVALNLADLGLRCVEEDPLRRPDIRWVVGRISNLYLESQTWMENMGPLPSDFTLSSLAPR